MEFISITIEGLRDEDDVETALEVVREAAKLLQAQISMLCNKRPPEVVVRKWSMFNEEPERIPLE